MDTLGYGPAKPVSELIRLIDEAWTEWLNAIALVPHERMAEAGVCEAWSVKDLYGHVAFWDIQVLDDLDGYSARRPPLKNPWNDWNATEAAKRADRTADDVHAEMMTAHAAVLERLQTLEQVDAEMVGVDTWEHYAEHTAHIRAWLARA